MTVVQILIWNLAASKTTVAELRQQLPPLPNGDAWIGNDAQERFGLVSLSGDVPELESLRRLIGKDPDVAEEFDAL